MPQAAMNDAYATLTEADDWFAARRIEGWDAHENDDRSAALLRASEWIDRVFAFAGAPRQEDQPRAWPRTGVAGPDGRNAEGIPDAVLEAVLMLALALLDDDETAEAAIGIGAVISQQKAGGVEITYAGEGRQTTRIRRLLEPYLRRRDSRALRRG